MATLFVIPLLTRMVCSLKGLLQESWTTYRSLMRPVLAGAIVFGVVIGLGGLSLQKGVMHQLGAELAQLEGMENVSEKQMQELLIRIQKGDEQSVEELREHMTVASTLMGVESIDMAKLPIMMNLVRFVSVFAILMWCITAISSVYYLVLATDKLCSTAAAMKRSLQVLVPLIGLGIWISIRSFIWVPFVGFIVAIVLMPRFLPAPVLLLQGEKGIMNIVSQSYVRTRGYWWKIMGNILAAMLCSLIAFIAFNVSLRTLAGGSVVALSLGSAVISQLVTAYITFFVAALSNTVLGHPIVPGMAAPKKH